MRIAKSMTTIVVGLSSIALVTTTSPVSAKANPTKTKHTLVALEQKSGAAVDVSTEVDCTTHTMSAKVTNKLDKKITPTVTFNKDDPTVPLTFPIGPGKTGNYFYNFSSNHLLVDTSVAVDGYTAVTVSPTIHCEEPISFRVDQTSKSAVTGYLQNNSSLVSQTVLTRINNGDIRTEVLAPGESRLIALPFAASEGQNTAWVTIGTTTGYEGTYSVDLTKNPIIIK